MKAAPGTKATPRLLHRRESGLKTTGHQPTGSRLHGNSRSSLFFVDSRLRGNDRRYTGNRNATCRHSRASGNPRTLSGDTSHKLANRSQIRKMASVSVCVSPARLVSAKAGSGNPREKRASEETPHSHAKIRLRPDSSTGRRVRRPRSRCRGATRGSVLVRRGSGDGTRTPSGVPSGSAPRPGARAARSRGPNPLCGHEIEKLGKARSAPAKATSSSSRFNASGS